LHRFARSNSPIGQNADLAIIAKSTNPTGFANFYTAAMAICDSLVLSIALANLDGVNREFDFYLFPHFRHTLPGGSGPNHPGHFPFLYVNGLGAKFRAVRLNYVVCR